MKSKQAKTVEEIAMAERERERLKSELGEAEDQVCGLECTTHSVDVICFCCIASDCENYLDHSENRIRKSLGVVTWSQCPTGVSFQKKGSTLSLC